VVRVQKDGELPDGSNFVHPETSAIIRGNTIYLFCRNDLRHIPIIYKSEDSGKTWSFPMSHDIPFSNSKIYSGTLSDGRNYVIGNIFSGRNKLAVFLQIRMNSFSEKAICCKMDITRF